MGTSALSMEHVFKKFRRGEYYDSLRDLVPGMVRTLLRRPATDPSLLRQREFWALQDVSFDVQTGEAFGIIGHNGAGKSTMLKLLSGIMKPTKGSLHVNGRLSALIEVGAGFHPDLTGRENIFLNGTILGMDRAEIRRKFDEIVEFSGLADFIDTPLKRYSSGMHARLGFSVAAHLEPDILVIDEVLSVGDYAFQRKSLAKMKSAIQSGATVVFVSHNLKAVAELCSRAILLDRGSVVASGGTSDVIRHYLERGGGDRARASQEPVYVSSVAVRGQGGNGVTLDAGEKVVVDVEVTANQARDGIAVVLFVVDEGFNCVFTSSTQRLGHGALALGAGERGTCAFELSMHLGPGMYYLGVGLYRYAVQQTCDEYFPAATMFVSSDRDVQGVANLYPRVLSMEVTPEEEAEVTTATRRNLETQR